MPIDILTGHDLSDTSIDLMNRQRIHEYQTNTKNFKQNELDSTFFFVKDDEQMKAFGMLKPVTVFHTGQAFSILGIGNIIAIEKGHGYGHQLMQAIQAYLDKKKRIGLGFCDKRVAGFYEACGYHIVDDLSTRIRYPLAHLTNEREHLTKPRHILCHDPVGGFIDTLQTPGEPIYINQPFW